MGPRTAWVEEVVRMLNALAPRAGFETLRDQMDRFFAGFGDWGPPEMRPLGDWNPKLDFSETKDAWVVRVEAPGVDPKEIEVLFENGMLTIKGEKEIEKGAKEEQFYRMERSYGAFVRTLRLPAAVDGSRVTATFKNGLLMVTLPKALGAKANPIPVKAE
jgi:HSP20 family protein